MTTKTETAAEPAVIETVTLKPRAFDNFREAFLASETDDRPMHIVMDIDDAEWFVLCTTEHQAKTAVAEMLIKDVRKLKVNEIVRLSREAMAPA